MAHFLKRLELNGFKSFAQKTVLEFPPGITAIVGPNGSGKSNVVDAIRWLLGEREAKSLRGAKVEDLIFAGTPKRPRMGQAQASLHFENGNKFFPVEAAEVTVTRQVSRDGASKYFLNKSEILLRDLIDFFAKARLGSRGLIVITQGNADIFIRSNPSDRREMIEEILGLREYQIKKADSERRLKNSQVNLDKARALIEEILPHLRSLKRQTSRWEKRGELEEELRTLENHFFGTQFGRMRVELLALQSKMDAHREELTGFQKEKEAAVHEQEKIEQSHPEEQKRVVNIREQIRVLLENRSTIEKEVGRIEAQLELAQKSTKKTEHSAERMLHLLEEVRDRLEVAVESDPDTMHEQIEAMIKDVNAFFESDEETETAPVPEFSGVREQCEKLTKNLEGVKRELIALREEEKALDSHQEKFYAEFKEAIGRVEAVRKKIEAWENKNREYVFEKQRLELRKEELVRQIVQAGRDKKEFEGAEPSPLPAGHDASSTERRIFKLRGDLASIGEIDQSLVKEATETETRYEFLKKESEDLERAVKDLKELIRDLNEKIKSEFEAAIIKINEEFVRFFELMFGGGHARLRVVRPVGPVPVPDGETLTEEMIQADREAQEGGIEIDLKLPRKKINSLDALSGGERSLVGIAALFALISVSPPPFLVLDEVDAALDDRNSKRFGEMLKEFSKTTQFIVVTHNRMTMESANVLYGVTLNEDGTSKILSMKFESEAVAK